MKLKYLVSVIGKITVSVLLVWWVLSRIDFDVLLEQISLIWWQGLLIPIAVFVFLGILQAWRWRLVMKAVGEPLEVNRAIDLTMLGLFFNQTLPSTIGGDGIRVWHLCKSGTSFKSAASGVVADRLFALFALILMGTIALPFIYITYGNILVVKAVSVVISIGLIGFIALLQFHKIPQFFFKLKLLRGVLSISKALQLVLKLPQIALLVIANSILIHTIIAVSIFYLSWLVGSEISLLSCLLIFPSVFLISSIPISIAGWGVRESAMVIGFASIGVDEVSAASVSLLFGVCMLALGLIGGAWWLYQVQKQ